MQCNEPYTEDNVVTILPAKESDKQSLIARSQRLAEQGLTHSLKKAPGTKKRKKHANGEATAEKAAVSEQSTAPGRSDQSAPNGIKNAATATLTARILEEENEKKKRRKMMGGNGNLDSLFTKTNGRQSSNTDFMTRGFSLPANTRK